MVGYKGFDKDLKCQDKQYAIGETFEEPSASLCKKGMHFCETPHDCFGYYKPAESRYCKVYADDVSDETGNDSKRVCKKLKIGEEITVSDIVKTSVSIFFQNFHFAEKISESCTNTAGNCGAANAGYCGAANAGDYGAANAGYCGAANAGYYGAANAGYYGAANAGDHGAANAGYYGAANAGYYGAANAGDHGAANAGYCGAANAGNYGAANAGDYGAANAGDCGAANAGYCGAANAGDYGAANAGYYGAAIVRKEGKASVGIGGVAVALGKDAMASGKIGAVLVLVERDDAYNVIHHRSILVDGVKYATDTYYMLKNNRVRKVGVKSQDGDKPAKQ